MIALLMHPCDTSERRREAPGDVLHIEVPVRGDEEPDRYVMLCGIVATADETAKLSPPIDFYTYEWGWKGTCGSCRRIYETPPCDAAVHVRGGLDG